jgi:hypothetical protein
MTGFTDYHADHVLDYSTGKTAMPTLPTVYIALFTAVGSDAGTGFTEVSGGSYARAATAGADWNAAGSSAPSKTSNVNPVTFITASGGWGTVIALGAYDALTSGNLLWWDYLGSFNWLPCTVSAASPGIITAPAHGLIVADTIVFSTEYGGGAPSFSASNFTGLLAVAHRATDTLDVTNSATQVNTSSTGSGMIRKVAATSIVSGNQASFAGGSPGQLTLTLA